MFTPPASRYVMSALVGLGLTGLGQATVSLGMTYLLGIDYPLWKLPLDMISLLVFSYLIYRGLITYQLNHAFTRAAPTHVGFDDSKEIAEVKLMSSQANNDDDPPAWTSDT